MKKCIGVILFIVFLVACNEDEIPDNSIQVVSLDGYSGPVGKGIRCSLSIDKVAYDTAGIYFCVDGGEGVIEIDGREYHPRETISCSCEKEKTSPLFIFRLQMVSMLSIFY